MTSSSVSPYLRRRSRRSCRRRRTSSRRFGSSSMRSVAARSSRGGVAEVGDRVAEPLLHRGERPPVRQGGDRRPQQVERTPVVDESSERGAGRLPVRGGTGEEILLGVERAVLVAVRQAGGEELVELEAHQVELPRPGSPVAAEGGDLGVESRQSTTSVPQRADVDPGEAVERRRVGWRWTAGADGRAGRAGRAAGRRRRRARRPWPSARPCTRATGPSAGTTRARTRSSSVRTNRPSTRASVAPGRTIVASARPPMSQSMAVTSIVLPAPVSPVSTVRPGPSRRSTSAMTPRFSMRSSLSTLAPQPGTQRSLNPNLAFRIWWKSRRPNCTNRATVVAGGAVDGVTFVEGTPCGDRRRRAPPSGVR